MRIRLALVACSLLACAPPNKAAPYPPPGEPLVVEAEPAPEPEPAPTAEASGIVRYFDREIDLQPFLAGFPYGRWQPSLRTGKLFYFSIGDAYGLRMLEPGAGAPWDLGGGKPIGEVDWSKRSLWSIHHHAPSDSLWLHADAANDEKMNLWRVSLKDGAIEQVTDHDYVYGLGFSADDKTIAYLPRAGKQAPFRTCLRIRDVGSGDEREVVCDTPALTFTWSELRFSPDASAVYFTAQVSGDRNRVQLVRVDLSAKTPRVETLTNTRARRSDLTLLDIDSPDELVYVANDDGFANLHAYSRKTKKSRQLTKLTEDITSAERVDDGIIAVHRTPAGSTLVLVDPATGQVRDSKRFAGSVDVIDGHGHRAWLTQESPDIVFEALEVDTTGGRLAVRQVAAPDAALAPKVVACKATAVQIPTFDTDKKTGKQRLLHAFLLEPREPLADPEQRLGLITSFYGGSNSFSELDQVFCAAGLTVVSPSVRGSDGFGRDFHALNDRDLGGDEIVDLFWVARWLEQRAGLDAQHIGVYGGSHGGYATMRAMTFPPSTNERNDSYPFGFGMSHAGFSDIKTFHDACNIPDWVVLESGDPSKAADLAKMKDRSPLSHVDRLQMPLLLTHGSNDWRVPVDESRQFVREAEKRGAPVTYTEFAGQGHRIEGLALQVKLFQTRFDFLMAVARGASGGTSK
jgi:dipeptidyl aminopeptidase/acylaminoacyl peptidase